MAARTGSGFRAAWANRRWRPLVVSSAVSCTGDLLYIVAFVVVLDDRTSSPATWLAVTLVARMLAFMFIGPFGGVLADRFDRRRLLFSLDAARAVGMALITGIAVVEGPVIAIAALTVVDAAATALYRPVAAAVIPELVPEDDLVAANAAGVLIELIGYFAGPALGALVVATAGPPAGFAANALTYAVAAVLIGGIGYVGGGRTPRARDDVADPSAAPAPGAAGPDPTEEAPAGFLHQLSAGVRAMRASPGLVAIGAFVAASSFVPGFERVTHVLVVEQRFGLEPEAVGVLGAAIGVGALLMAPLSTKAGAAGRGSLLLLLACVLMGLAVGSLALIGSIVVASVVLALEGMGVVLIEVVAITLLQRGAPRAVLAHVIGLLMSMAALAFMVGSIAAPVLDNLLGLRGALLVGGAVPVVIGLLGVRGVMRLEAAAEAERRAIAPIVEQLAATDAFGDASPAALEQLARAGTRRTVTVGTDVVREGDVSDRFFLVLSGAYRAHGVVADTGAAWSNAMSVGDVFGEIGVLRGSPRTATVTCTEDGELLEIDADAFRAAVFETPARLNELVDLRLARSHPHPIAR